MMKGPQKRNVNGKKADINMERAMELSDEEWERLIEDEPRDFPKSYYLCKQNPEEYDGMDV